MKEKSGLYKLLAFVLLILIIIVAQVKFNILPFSSLVSSSLTKLLSGFSRDKIIATVNGEKILESEFNATYNSMKFANPQITKSEVLDLLIEQKVLVSKAKSLGITINDSEFKFYLQQYIDQVGGEREFENTLNSLGVSRKMFEDLLREQIYIQKLFEQYYFDQVRVDDEEVDQFIEQYFGSKESVNESVKESIKDALLAQKRIDFIQEKVDELVAQADIKILINLRSSILNKEEDTGRDLVLRSESESQTGEQESEEKESSPKVESSAVDLKDCVEKKISKVIDFFVICEDCDSFKSFFEDKTDKAYIGVPDETTISLIKDCLSEVYQGYLPEVICLNNGQSLTENFDSELENFFNACI